MSIKTLIPFFFIFLSSIFSKVYSQAAVPIIYVPEEGVGEITYKGELTNLFMIIDVRDYDLSHDLEFLFNAPDSRSTKDIGYYISSNDIKGYSYEELTKLSYKYNDMFCDIYKKTNRINNTYTYTIEKEMIGTFDSYMIVRFPISASSKSITYRA